MLHASILHRASAGDMNPFSYRPPWRNLPLNDSTVALSDGVPGREKSLFIPPYTHLSSIFPANSEALSVFSSCGKGRLSAILFSISATTIERRFCPTQIPGYSRLYKVNHRQQTQPAAVKQRNRDKIHAQTWTLRLWLTFQCGRLSLSGSLCSRQRR